MSPRHEVQGRPLHQTVVRWVLAFVVVDDLSLRLGRPRVLGLVGDALVVLFLAYLVRHLIFVALASRSGPGSADDAAAAEPVDPASVRHRVSVLVPCRDEALVVDQLVAALDALVAPAGGLQVVLIDDRSTDATPALLDEAAAPRGWQVVHRVEGARPGKSAALNDALTLVDGDVVVVFDADHQPRPDAVLRLARHFDDERVAAAQGRCVVGNGGASPLARLIALDYLCGYLVNMVGRAAMFGLPAYGGANCAVRTRDVRALGGWNEASVTEDTDLTMQLVLEGRQVRYDATAIDVESAVTTVRRFWRQRYRWARGHQQVCVERRWDAITSKHLSPLQRLETLAFLFSFHVPVLCVVAVILVAATQYGPVPFDARIDPWPLIPLMMSAPLIEIGAGLVAGRVQRRRAWDLCLFPLLYVISMAVCTKAMLDRWLGRRYGWAKTERTPGPPATADGPPTPAPAVPALARPVPEAAPDDVRVPAPVPALHARPTRSLAPTRSASRSATFGAPGQPGTSGALSAAAPHGLPTWAQRARVALGIGTFDGEGTLASRPAGAS